MSTDEVRDAYDANAQNVVKMLGSKVSTTDPDRAVIEPWADTVRGRILDVGSGTGRWAGHLASLGHPIDGLEPVERLVDIARTANPAVTFQLGTIDDLAGSDDRWAGILAWYSLIHLGPDHLPNALATLRSVLEDDGTMLMSFFSGLRLEPFDHPVVTAYRWPLPDMARALNQAGFEVISERWDGPAPHAIMLVRA
ncbi:class I SAM-dependent methyltransferase [Rhodococcus sp. PAMC28707]|uniref:class I SAM-dependent methyltransferase n=1 Tax=unclassified Rhodococcus (in: high G+C Gram-positive bacteria) TaxID=192944 RepID=UPI00109E027B|nr:MULTISPECIES: class I SAM-dependent methyltransferase [unclassified Rhodococcus (in: high G+C Gram-positive bacteria)]QCB49693.1 class I SAM-dependent methyltransferase [Rhodococcus sp. PAMC28705]QCB58615.1 class I SAM-dependent methyltransferase [Rhodococcus sp. PAMC28707]